MPQWELISTGPDANLLRLSGDWGVEQAEELHQVFLQALEGARRLDVDMEKVGGVDLSFFQVVYAALKNGQGAHVGIVNVPEALAAKAAAMGFSPRHVPDNLWKGATHGQTHHDRG